MVPQTPRVNSSLEPFSFFPPLMTISSQSINMIKRKIPMTQCQFSLNSLQILPLKLKYEFNVS
jgi:hypothetical protein